MNLPRRASQIRLTHANSGYKMSGPGVAPQTIHKPEEQLPLLLPSWKHRPQVHMPCSVQEPSKEIQRIFCGFIDRQWIEEAVVTAAVVRGAGLLLTTASPLPGSPEHKSQKLQVVDL